MDVAGEAITIIIGVNTTTIEAEAMDGINSKTMTSKASVTIPMVTMVNTPHHNNNIMANNPDQCSHNRLPIYVIVSQSRTL